MRAKNFEKMVVLAVVLVCVSVGYVRADKLQLQEKLSKDIDIQIRDVTITEALGKIGQKAGVKIVLSDEAAWRLPYGEATRLSVSLSGPLADSMTEMLNAFLMRYALGDEEITIYPRPELERILGRPMIKQLEVLRKIYTLQFNCNESGGESTYMAELINERFGPEGLTVLPTECYEHFVRELRPTGEIPFTLAQLLDSTHQTWYLCGMDFPNQAPEVRVVNEREFGEAKLDQIVDISFKDETAEAIIQRLANWTGMELLVQKKEASWLNEKISVEMQNVKLKQALRNVVGTVDGDISIEVEENEIHVYGPVHVKKPTVPKATGSRSGDYVGKISIPMDGGKYYIEFMLRESDLTEELKKLRAERMKEILGQPPKPKP